MGNNYPDEIEKVLQEAFDVQKKYEEAFEKLKQENQFLADTITNNKLGKIATERREILAKLYKAESDSKTAVAEANATKSEYEQKLGKLAVLTEDLKKKLADVDAYIDEKVESRTSRLEDECERHKKANNRELAKRKAENNIYLQEQLDKYKRQHAMIIACGIIGMLVGILGFLY